MKRSGVLLPVFSLPGRYGIGSLGEEAYRFADFLAETGQDSWQVLPLNPTSYGDSPYQSPSAYAGNPYFIDLDILREDGLLTETECDAERTNGRRIDYAALYERRYVTLRKAYARFGKNVPDSFADFVQSNRAWLRPYCRFMARKEENGGRAWTEWRNRAYSDKDDDTDTDFWAFLQYEFFTQWSALKAYTNAKEIKIIGDMPIYVAMDSADVWANPEYFQLTEDLLPERVAGVPPDAFTADGQLWGNPLYDWDSLKADGYRWWLDRFRHALNRFDAVRIDHFRGFAAYYSIPYGETTARCGKWVKAPGSELFQKVNREFPQAEILAEDLGYLDDSVRALLKKTGYPGMRIAQFGFDEPDSAYLPTRYPAHCVAYTGTHDNATAKAWAKGLSRERLKTFRRSVGKGRFETDAHALVRSVLASAAELAIIPMQDYLELGEDGRINTPSTVGGNWTWRLPENYAKRAKRMADLRRFREGKR